MNSKQRFSTNLKVENLKAIQYMAINNGTKRNELIDEAIKQFLENTMIRVKVWLPKSYTKFLHMHDRLLEEIIREPLAVEVYSAFANGKLTREEATEIVKELGYKRIEDL